MNNYNIKVLLKVDVKTAKEITDLLFQLEPTTSIISVERLKTIISSTTTFIFIATNTSEEIVGMITLVIFPNLEGYKAWIEDLVVDEKYRGQGVAKALINKALEKAKSLDAKTVSLTSQPSRIIANLLYKKLGFIIRETNYYIFYFNKTKSRRSRTAG